MSNIKRLTLTKKLLLTELEHKMLYFQDIAVFIYKIESLRDKQVKWI